MPKMRDTMPEGVNVAWHKKAGDPVKPVKLLADAEIDKAPGEVDNFEKGTML